jgi:hypothetical protein
LLDSTTLLVVFLCPCTQYMIVCQMMVGDEMRRDGRGSGLSRMLTLCLILSDQEERINHLCGDAVAWRNLIYEEGRQRLLARFHHLSPPLCTAAANARATTLVTRQPPFVFYTKKSKVSPTFPRNRISRDTRESPLHHFLPIFCSLNCELLKGTTPQSASTSPRPLYAPALRASFT